MLQLLRRCFFHIDCSRIFYFIFIILYVFTATPPAQSRPTSKQEEARKKEKIAKDVRKLQEDSSTLQKKLISVAKDLEQVIRSDISKEDKPGEAIGKWVIGTFQGINHHVQKKIHGLFSGFSSLRMAIVSPDFQGDLLIYQLVRFLFSLCAGILAILGTRSFIKRGAEKLIRTLRRQHVRPISSIPVLGVFLVLPFLICLLLSGVVTLLVNAIVPLSAKEVVPEGYYFFLLPAALCSFWAISFWAKISFSHAEDAILPLERHGAHSAAIWLKSAFWTFLISGFILELSKILKIPIEGQMTLSDVTGLLVGVFLTKGLGYFQRCLGETLTRVEAANAMRWISGMKWAVIFLCVLWLSARRWFDFFLPPILFTGLCLAVSVPLEKIVRYWRLSFLWRRRSRSFFLKVFLRSQRWIDHIVHYGIYVLLIVVWWLALRNFDEFELITYLKEVLASVFSGPRFEKVSNCVFIMIAAYMLMKVGGRALRYYVEERHAFRSQENSFLASRLKTLMAMLMTLLRVVVWVPTIMIIASYLFEANMTALITSLGAAGFAVGFGLQSTLRDFISGFFIIVENNLMMGDEVEIDRQRGRVEDISMRTLKIRTESGALMTIPFGLVGIIVNRSRGFGCVLVNASVGYHEDLDKVQSAIERAFYLIRRTPSVGKKIIAPLEIRGLGEVTGFSVVFQARIRTMPGAQESVRFAFNRILKQVFDEAGIMIPEPARAISQTIPSLSGTVITRPYGADGLY